MAEAVQKLGLAHVVLTCVSRDDLPDGGAEHFCRTIDAIRGTSQAVTIEVLPSDFAGNGDSVDRLADALPEVYNYNTETVPRLFRDIRGPMPDFQWTLEIFRRIRRRRPTVRCKSGLMLGLGETDEEIINVLHKLYAAGCEAVTLGQYLQPNADCIAVDRYVTPEEFGRFGEIATKIGFISVASAPFVRSSYHARPLE